MHKIIAIIGMCGSGKSIACDWLEEKGYQKVYFGGITLEKLKEAGKEITPENEREMWEGLRKQYGMGVYAVLSLPKIQEYLKTSNVVIDGLYSWSEYLVLREAFDDQIQLVCVIADKALRYSRIACRAVRGLTSAQAEQRDIAEIENMQKGGPIAFADFYISNQGTVAEFQKQLEQIIEVIE